MTSNKQWRNHPKNVTNGQMVATSKICFYMSEVHLCWYQHNAVQQASSW